MYNLPCTVTWLPLYIQSHHDLGDDDDTDDDVAECNDDEDAWHHRHRGVVWGLLPERRPSKYIPFNYVHHMMFWCLAWLDGPSGQREGHKISSPRAVPRDWWTIYWHACGGCRTQPIAWCQIPRTPAGLSLTPSPFAKAGRLYMGPWGLWGCWNCSEPHAFHHHLSSGLGLSVAGTGKLDEKYAGCLIQWRALRPAADQALHSPQLWGTGTALASSLSR